MIVLIFVIIILAVSFILLYKKFKPNDNIIELFILKGIDAGISDITYESHHINIYFNNNISLLHAWNCNKYYSWISDGELMVGNKSCIFHDRPALKVLKKLDKEIKKFEKERLTKTFIDEI